MTEKFKALEPNKRRIIIGSSLAILALVAVVGYRMMVPERSVSAYCKTFASEKTRLAKYPGNTYPSGVFNDSLSDAGQFATSFGRLERVAPSDIKPDVTTLKSLYQKMHDDPSSSFAASLSGIGAENSVKQWTDSHCSSVENAK